MNNLRTWMASTRVRIVAGALALLVVGGVMGAVISTVGAAHAAGDASNGANATTPTGPASNMAAYCQQYEATLASNLGVSTGKLESSNVAALETVLAQMVKDGKITQAQADQAKTMLTANGTNICSHIGGLMGKFGGHRGGGPGRFGAFGPAIKTVRTAVQQAVATELNLTVTQLQSDLATTDIVALAKTKGVTQTALNTTITNTVKSQLDGLVKAGTVNSTMETQALTMLAQQLTAGHYGLFGLGPMGPMGR